MERTDITSLPDLGVEQQKRPFYGLNSVEHSAKLLVNRSPRSFLLGRIPLKQNFLHRLIDGIIGWWQGKTPPVERSAERCPYEIPGPEERLSPLTKLTSFSKN
ncbi:MAG: hypothetical protein PHE48_04695 [Candidatus Daviesbacteria bacterium]|nr:hypothetical protein [Candidatus Daviesbacteria bacterium]